MGLASPRRMVVMVSLAVAFATSGCTFFYIPADKAAESLHSPISFVRSELAAPFQSFGDVAAAVSSVFAVPDTSGFLDLKEGPGKPEGDVILEFLQVSDAQVRDETVYTQEVREQQGFFDFIVSVSTRNPHVEALDSLVLASFLAAYKRRAETLPGALRPFVIHTGDALDISLATELVEVLNVFGETDRGGLPVYSVAGNHDGLLYGNISDFWAIDYRMGINLTEFIYGHHAADPARPSDLNKLDKQGFGFGANEVYANLESYDAASLRNVAGRFGAGTADTLRGLKALKEKVKGLDSLTAAERTKLLQSPAALKELIDAGAGGEGEDLQLGYYDWQIPIVPVGPLKAFRGVVLDTRAGFWASGHFGLVQAGWLYRVLRKALKEGEAVLIFAHHEPDGLGKNAFFVDTPGEDALEALLDSFPNVVGYFYGHGHENTVEEPTDPGDPLVLQTGSTVDFPQVARLIQVKAMPSVSDCEIRLRVVTEFVRPQGLNTVNGLRLQGKLGAALRESWLKQTIEEDLWGDITSMRILYWLFAGLDYQSGKSRWSKLERMEMRRTLRFPKEAPTAEEVFGSWDADTVRRHRSALDLPWK